MKNLIIAISIIFGGLGIGLLLEKILFKKIKKLVTQKKWKTGKVLMDSLKGKVVFLITFFCIYFAIPYMSVLKFQPQTVTIISKVTIVLILLILTLIFQRFLSSVVLNYLKLTLPTTTSIFKNIINISVLILGLFVIFQTIGIKITPLITALGVGGLAVALALQDSLSNLFAGLHIIAVKQIKVGDYIKLESGEEGYVVDIGWRNTTIRMIPNNLVIVPNSKIASSIVVNYNLPE
ncbi:MAG TPA: mechanosensitive ion channel, partial [Candidatus Atribacteria bacterium]|nr:mechanosensitive ion channel [Candidatus Atribacteria bacterium]